MSSIRYVDESGTNPDYEDLLQSINTILGAVSARIKKEQKSSLFSLHPELTFDLDTLADHIMKQFIQSGKASAFENLLPKYISDATIQFESMEKDKAFSDGIQLVLERLTDCLNTAYSVSGLSATPKQDTLAKALRQYGRKLPKINDMPEGEKWGAASNATMKGIASSNIMKDEIPIFKQKLQATPVRITGTETYLKGTKVTIGIEGIPDIGEQLGQSILSSLEQYEELGQPLKESEKKRVQQAVQMELSPDSPDSMIRQIEKATIEEAAARILRTAQMTAIQYTIEGMDIWKKQEKEPGLALLRNLYKRLAKLDLYGRPIPPKQASDYTVTFSDPDSNQMYPLNYSDILGRANLFDTLPIIPLIVGLLAEESDLKKGSKKITLGVKWKLNGLAMAHGGVSSFLYHLCRFDCASSGYQEQKADALDPAIFFYKVARTIPTFLLLHKLEDEDYDPVNYFDTEVLPVLQGDDQQAKDALLKQLYDELLPCETQLTTLRELIVTFLGQDVVGPDPKTYTKTLSIKSSMLNRDLDAITNSNDFFYDVDPKNRRSVLKHISIEEARGSRDSLSRIPVRISFDPLYFSPSETRLEKASMSYDTNLDFLPIYFTPDSSEMSAFQKEKIKDSLKNVPRCTIMYRHHPQYRSGEAFIYCFVFQLLAYLYLKVVASKVAGSTNRRFFYPIICIHTRAEAQDDESGQSTASEKEAKSGKRYETETFIHNFCKTLEFMLGQDYLTSSQGVQFHTLTGTNSYKVNNALASLYSTLSRTFKPSTRQAAYKLPSAAIIVMSTRKSDVNRQDLKSSRAVLAGQIFTFERQPSGDLRLSLFDNFSTIEPHETIYDKPDILVAQAKKLAAAGIKHIFLVAHSPYSRNLKLEEKPELYFMRPANLQAMRAIDSEIRVYPILCDKYYVVNLRLSTRAKNEKKKSSSLYVDDIGELGTISIDSTRRSVIFFNVFTGATVRPDSIFNGVMSYSTLISPDPDDLVYDQYIWNDLLSRDNTFRDELLEVLTYIHFWKYEKSFVESFKLDPYTFIIGDDSVLKLSIIPHFHHKIRFNSLAFLTKVRGILRRAKA